MFAKHPLLSILKAVAGSLMHIPLRITVAELRQMKSAVWLPGARWTSRHLLWVPKLSSSQCALRPTYEQLLDAIHISTVMACLEACWSAVLSGPLTDAFECR